MSFEEFVNVLKTQDVDSLSFEGARGWFAEVPIDLMQAYLRKRDHRVRGALLHKAALESAHAEQQVAAKHPFAMQK